MTGQQTVADFSRHGHELVDWIEEYLSALEEGEHRFPVRAASAPGAVAAALAEHAPETGEPLHDILADAKCILLPGITHWQHPGFLAYFATTATEPGILAEMFSAALNVNGMLWATSPAATELEQRTVRWLAHMVGLDDRWFGQITDTASTSSLLALAAARDADGALDVRARGLAGRADVPVLRAYCSELAHSSIDKAVMTLGVGHDNLVKVPVDAEFRMRPDALARCVAEDRATGYRPFAVAATVGTTSVASVDPVAAIADICEREKLWLHVDAAYAGAASVAPEFRWALSGVERADSLVINPHKWLITPVGVSVLWVRDAQTLRRAFSLVPEYLRTNTADVVDYHDVGFQLGRPFRALKLWMVLRAYGVQGLAAHIRAHCAAARTFAGWVQAAPEWEVVAPVHFSLVCFRHTPGSATEEETDAANARILEAVNRSGRVYLSHTRLNGRYVMRLAIGNARTREEHVRVAWNELLAASR